MNYLLIGVFCACCFVISALVWWFSILEVSVLIPSLIVCILAVGILILARRSARRAPQSTTLVNPATCNESEQSASNYSGRRDGPPLKKDAISANTKMLDIIDEGTFGQVRRGRFHGEIVAIKIFLAEGQESFENEKEIYEIQALPHDNILRFIATNTYDTGRFTEFWIITEFHELGSLQDYLQRSSVDKNDLIRMCLSIAQGLQHLHNDICGKPAIAHRDLKSKNVLVKTNRSCVIADFGLAVRSDRVTESLKTQVGTKRYMAPEVLRNTLNPDNFQFIKTTDIYSVSLIYWEICQRMCGTYQKPFYDVVSSDPTIEEMRKVVCLDRQRPSTNGWESNDQAQVLLSMREILNSCWLEQPSQRKTATEVLDALEVID